MIHQARVTLAVNSSSHHYNHVSQ